MRSNLQPTPSLWRGVAVYALALFILVWSLSCQSRTGSDATAARGLVIVNAPAAGEVRRVLVSEGMPVNEGAPVVEIAVRVDAPPGTMPAATENPQARAGRNIQAAQAEIEAARAEVVRTEVEVQRLTPLAASGDAPQGQLDGARAEYERAQQRLQRAQTSSQSAQSGLVAARQQAQNSTPATSTSTRAITTSIEQLVVARAASAGTVSAVSARVGERVVAGQPLATLRASN